MLYTWRTSAVQPGGVVYITFPKGGGGEVVPTLPSGWTFFWPAWAFRWQWHIKWAWGVRIAPNAATGNYTLATPAGDVVVTVVAAPAARPVQRIEVGSVATVQAHLDGGKDIEFAAGRHDITAPITVPAGATIDGEGAVLRRKFDGAYAQRMFVPQGGMTLRGVTLDHDGENDADVVYLHEFPWPAGHITVDQVTVRRGQLIRYGPEGLLVRRSRFDKGTSGLIPSRSVWLENEFYGPNPMGYHSFMGNGVEGALLASNRFIGVTRGPVFQGEPSIGNVVLDTHIIGVRGGEPNAGECIMFESAHPVGGGCRDNAFIDVWIQDCSGPGLQIYGSGMSGNIFHNFEISTDRDGVTLIAIPSEAQPNPAIGANTFTNFQITAAMVLQGEVGGQVFTDMQWVDAPQRRGNQGSSRAELMVSNSGFPIRADATAKAKSYTFNGCGVVRMDRSYSPISSVGAEIKTARAYEKLDWIPA